MKSQIPAENVFHNKLENKVNNSFENGVYTSTSGSNIIYREHTIRPNTDR